jgi:type III secretion system YopN/LcrE/InvE/MxiC family regulator
MVNPIIHGTTRPNPRTEGTPPNQHAPGLAPVIPPHTVTTMAATALHPTHQRALTEAGEDVAMMLGHRARLERNERRDNAEGTRRSLVKMARTFDLFGNEELIAAIAAFENSGNNDHELPAATQLLVLAALLERPGLNGSRRKRYEDAFEALLADNPDWRLDLFASLELGANAAASMQQLKALYQQANVASLPLTQWLTKLGEPGQRRRKIKILLRALGMELSSESEHVTDLRLVMVVRDLKRLLIFLGLEEQCERIAARINQPALGTEQTLAIIVAFGEELFVDDTWLDARLDEFMLDSNARLVFAQFALQLVKLLPDPCFSTDVQREQAVEMLTQYVHAHTPDD